MNAKLAIYGSATDAAGDCWRATRAVLASVLQAASARLQGATYESRAYLGEGEGSSWFLGLVHSCRERRADRRARAAAGSSARERLHDDFGIQLAVDDGVRIAPNPASGGKSVDRRVDGVRGRLLGVVDPMERSLPLAASAPSTVGSARPITPQNLTCLGRRVRATWRLSSLLCGPSSKGGGGARRSRRAEQPVALLSMPTRPKRPKRSSGRRRRRACCSPRRRHFGLLKLIQMEAPCTPRRAPEATRRARATRLLAREPRNDGAVPGRARKNDERKTGFTRLDPKRPLTRCAARAPPATP